MKSAVKVCGSGPSSLVASTFSGVNYYGVQRLSRGAVGNLNPPLGSLGSPPAGGVFAASTGILHYVACLFYPRVGCLSYFSVWKERRVLRETPAKEQFFSLNEDVLFWVTFFYGTYIR